MSKKLTFDERAKRFREAIDKAAMRYNVGIHFPEPQIVDKVENKDTK